MKQAPRREPRATFSVRRAALCCWVSALLYLQVCGLGLVVAQSISGPADASLTHNKADANQVFSEGTWTVTNPLVNGATATWKCAAFKHVNYANRKVNCRLALRLISADNLSNWAVLVGTDESNHLTSYEALVSAKSTFSGGASLGLTVTFLNSDFSILTSGNYRTTVTGTITAN